MERRIAQSELRKGNFVIDYNKEIKRVRELSVQSEPAGSWSIVGFEGEYHYNYTGDLTPIEITEEWLRKFGFSTKERWPAGGGDNFYREDRKIEVSISYRHGIQIRTEDKKGSTYMINYIHELQNIYKELTGEELPYEE